MVLFHSKGILSSRLVFLGVSWSSLPLPFLDATNDCVGASVNAMQVDARAYDYLMQSECDIVVECMISFFKLF